MNGAMRRLAVSFLGYALVLAFAGCGGDAPSVTAPQELDRAGIYLVPLDGSPRDRVAAVGDRLGEIYDAPVTVLPDMDSGIDAADPGREQFIGDAIVRQLQQAYPARAARVAVIGVTVADAYWSGAPLDVFTFGVVEESGHAVISTSRMDPANYGETADEELLRRRLGKMAGRYVARLLWNVGPVSEDPASAARISIRGLDDLDAMTPFVCPGRPRQRQAC